MEEAKAFALVLVTAPNLRSARALAAAVLGPRLAACVNIVPRIESHYWWKGKLEKGTEFLLVIKSTAQNLGILESAVLAHHPYDTPEFLVLPLQGGNQRYLRWLSESAQPVAGIRKTARRK